MGIRCSFESGKVKPSFSNWISESLFSILVWINLNVARANELFRFHFAKGRRVQRMSVSNSKGLLVFKSGLSLFRFKSKRVSVESRKMKSSLSNWISERTTFLQSNFVNDTARWTCTFFMYGIRAHPDLLLKP